MSKAPAFQWYPADFEIDTSSWDIDEVGLYIRLLNVEWTEGFLPDDPARLAKIGRISLRRFSLLWKTVGQKFHMNGNGFLFNKRLELVREKQIQFRQKQSDNARKRYMPNQQPDECQTDAKGLPNKCQATCQNDALQSSSSSSKNIKHFRVKPHDKPSEEPTPACTFDEFWQAYPRRNGKIAGKKECLDWWKLNSGKMNLLEFKAAVEAYARSDTSLGGFARDPIRFLKKEWWRDWIPKLPRKDPVADQWISDPKGLMGPCKKCDGEYQIFYTLVGSKKKCVCNKCGDPLNQETKP